MKCRLIKSLLKNVKYKINRWRYEFADQKPKLLILLYHRVLPEIKFNPLNTVITLKTFIKQIDILTKKYPIISLSDAIDQCRSGQAKARTQVVLTFDDGYWDNYEVIFPVLKEKGLSGTFFLATDYVNQNSPLWDWEVISLLLRNCRDARSIKVHGETLAQEMYESRLSFALRIIGCMRSASARDIQAIIGFLKSHSKIQPADRMKDGFITLEQVRHMIASGMEIGAHSVSHRSLSRLPHEEAIFEISRSKEIIEKWTEKPCIHFAFPFGSSRDYNEELIHYVKKTGFQSCLLNVRGYNHVEENGFSFKRIAMKEFSNLSYLLG